MTDKNTKLNPAILYSCYAATKRSTEQFVQDHSMCYVQSGKLEFQLSDQKLFYNEGEAFFIRRNVLAKATKHPGANGGFESISIFFSQDTLKDISLKKELSAVGNAQQTVPIVSLAADKLLKNYFESLPAYEQESSGSSLVRLKIEEGILLLLNRQPELQQVLFDFSEPGKIDLELFMNKHFRFNVAINRFASLTGRSLATFKRDFEKVFHNSPSRWLQNRRLEEARYMIKVKKMKPIDVYLEVGFEDLSHFSFAFKKTYGVAPSLI